MKKEIYLHIGFGKCGTTSIQNFLKDNTDLLLKHKACFPFVDLKTQNKRKITLDTSDAHLFNYSQNGEYLRNAIIKHHNKDIGKYIDDYLKKSEGCDKIIISSETMTHGDWDIKNLITALNNLDRNKYNITIILYIRRSIDYFVSFWMQWKRQYIEGWSVLSFDDFCKKFTPIYERSIENFLKIKSISNLKSVVRPYEKSQLVNENSIDDFIATIGINDDISKYKINLEKNNVSPSKEISELIDCVNIFKSGSTATKINKILIEQLSHYKGVKIIESLDNKQIEKVVSHFYPLECKIAEEFLGRKELFTEKYPECYGKPKKEVTSIDINLFHDFLNLLKSNPELLKIKEPKISKRKRILKKILKL